MENYDVLDTLSDEDYFNSLPPGYRFSPSNEELIMHYLRRYMHDQPLPRNRINNFDVYDYSPDQLTGRADVKVEVGEKGNKAWYFFTARMRKYGNGDRPGRKAGKNGFWKPSTKKNEIFYSGRVIGHVTSLVYYNGKHEENTKTNWLMQEYTLKNPPVNNTRAKLDSALCKLYVNPNKYRKFRSASPNSQGEIVQANIPPEEQIVVPVLVNHQQHENMVAESQAVNPSQEFQQQLQVYQEPGPSNMMNETKGSDDIIPQEVIPTQVFQQQHPQYYPSNFSEGQWVTASDHDNWLPMSDFPNISQDAFFEELPMLSECLSSLMTSDSNQQHSFNLYNDIFQNNNIPMQNQTPSSPMTFESEQQWETLCPPDNIMSNILMPNQTPDPVTFGCRQQQCPSPYTHNNALVGNSTGSQQQRDAICISNEFQTKISIKSDCK